MLSTQFQKKCDLATFAPNASHKVWKYIPFKVEIVFFRNVHRFVDYKVMIKDSFMESRPFYLIPRFNRWKSHEMARNNWH